MLDLDYLYYFSWNEFDCPEIGWYIVTNDLYQVILVNKNENIMVCELLDRDEISDVSFNEACILDLEVCGNAGRYNKIKYGCPKLGQIIHDKHPMVVTFVGIHTIDMELYLHNYDH